MNRAKKAIEADGVSTPPVDTVRDTALSVDAYRSPDGGLNSDWKLVVVRPPGWGNHDWLIQEVTRATPRPWEIGGTTGYLTQVTWEPDSGTLTEHWMGYGPPPDPQLVGRKQATDLAVLATDNFNRPKPTRDNWTTLPERAYREGDTQALPVKGHQDVILSVVDDLDSFLEWRAGNQRVKERLLLKVLSRRTLGIKRYGQPLETHNGRHAVVDAFEELLDLQNYLKQAALETTGQRFGELQNLYRVMMCYVVDLAEMLDKEGLL